MSSTFGIELKRYKIKDGGWSEFYEIWKRIVAVRKRHGFNCLFAFEDTENNWFTWAISHEDMDGASKRYYDDPERIELRIVENWVTEYEIRRVKQIPIP